MSLTMSPQKGCICHWLLLFCCCTGLWAHSRGPGPALQSGEYARAGLGAEEEHLQGRTGAKVADAREGAAFKNINQRFWVFPIPVTSYAYSTSQRTNCILNCFRWISKNSHWLQLISLKMTQLLSFVCIYVLIIFADKVCISQFKSRILFLIVGED